MTLINSHPQVQEQRTVFPCSPVHTCALTAGNLKFTELLSVCLPFIRGEEYRMGPTMF